MGGFISDDALDSVRAANDIVDVVSGYLRLEKKGKNYFGLCPFHPEKTPSFSVDPGKQLYYCFSCNRGGGVFQFIQEVERVEFVDAVRRLAERAGVALPESPEASREGKERRKERDLAVAMNRDAAAFFAAELWGQRGRAARDYLVRRQVSKETAIAFGLGFAPDAWEALQNALLAKGYSVQEQVAAGLGVVGKGGKAYDRFRGRLMFPIADVAGRIVAFGGRTLGPGEPKYLNSPETALFTKGRSLYGLDRAKSTREPRMYVVEGYMDCISLSAAGVGNVVASLGTALTEEQGRLLRRFVGEAVVVFDTDDAGRSAAARGMGTLSALGFSVKALRLPDGKDPDDFVRAHGGLAFKKLLDGALTYAEYRIDAAREACLGGAPDDLDSRARFAREASAVIASLQSPIEREMYAKRLAAELGVSMRSLEEEVDAAARAARRAKGRGADGAWSRRARATGGAVAGAAGGAVVGAAGVAIAGGSVAGSDAAAPGDISPGGISSTALASEGACPAPSSLQGAYPPSRSQGSYPAPASLQGAYPSSSSQGAAAAPDPPGPDDADELFVLALLCVDNSLAQAVAEQAARGLFANEGARLAAERATARIKSGARVDEGELASYLPDAAAVRFATAAALECHVEDAAKALEQKVMDIAYARNERELVAAYARYDAGEMSEEEMAAMREAIESQRDGMRRGRLYRPARFARRAHGKY